MLEFITNVIVYGFLACLVLMLCFPIILCFMECWRKTVLMFSLFAGAFLLAIGFAVLVNMLAAIVFLGSMLGLIIGAVWDKNYIF